jgi:hypothetical protein
MRLLDYAVNVNSQNGEDGIFAKILELIPCTDKWCVEFGAWDGRYLSNTCHLIEKSGYSAVLIEPDGQKFAGILKNHSGNEKIVALNRFVGFTPDDNLDHILANIPAIPTDFDLLSIDIEGNDYHVWEAMSSYTPKVVHIAYNPMIPTEVDFVQPADPKVNQGASLLALTRLARRKDYQLVCANHNSGIFVRSTYFHLFGIRDNDLRVLREDLSGITYLFCGYDGKIFIRGREFLGHHRGIRIQKRIRQLPKIFRSYPPNQPSLIGFLYKFYWRAVRLLGRG